MELISYAGDFVSFYVQNTKYLKVVRAIILFGSSARGEATDKSDVDIFIDVISPSKKIEEELEQIKNNFYDSFKYKDYWKAFGITNDLHLIIDKLENWKLKDSMLGNSIVLFKHFTPSLEKGKSKVILSWGNIKSESNRVLLNKRFFGYNHYGKRYSGLVEKYSGQKLGSNVIFVGIEYMNLFMQQFREFKISVKIKRVFEYET
ncbi:MAG: nucleotidyltransferase domain-containing protein [Nanoarchaeota archaeon]